MDANLIAYILGAVLANVIGIYFGIKIEKTKIKYDVSVGTLKVITNDPDGPYLFAELKDEPEKLLDKEYVVMTVSNPRQKQSI